LKEAVYQDCIQGFDACIKNDSYYHRAVYWKARSLFFRQSIFGYESHSEWDKSPLLEALDAMEENMVMAKKNQFITIWAKEFPEGMFETINARISKYDQMRCKYANQYFALLLALQDFKRVERVGGHLKESKERSAFVDFVEFQFFLVSYGAIRHTTSMSAVMRRNILSDGDLSSGGNAEGTAPTATLPKNKDRFALGVEQYPLLVKITLSQIGADLVVAYFSFREEHAKSMVGEVLCQLIDTVAGQTGEDISLEKQSIVSTKLGVLNSSLVKRSYSGDGQFPLCYSLSTFTGKTSIQKEDIKFWLRYTYELYLKFDAFSARCIDIGPLVGQSLFGRSFFGEGGILGKSLTQAKKNNLHQPFLSEVKKWLEASLILLHSMLTMREDRLQQKTTGQASYSQQVVAAADHGYDTQNASKGATPSSDSITDNPISDSGDAEIDLPSLDVVLQQCQSLF